MNTLQKGIVTLLKSAITGEKYDLPYNFKLEESSAYITMHSIEPLVYIGALNCGIKKDEPFMQVLFKVYCKMLLYSERQMAEVKRIYDAFEENNIDYMPVKGCNMKALYPNPEMRVMGDADILIKLEQYDKVKCIMSELGFKFISKGDHDYAWGSNNLHVELHYLLMYAYNDAYGEYFGNGWNRTAGRVNHKYYMSDEDDFIFQFIHFTKHYRIGGIGCRHVVDLWVYLRSHPELDFKYIEIIIEKLSVKEFYNNTMKLIKMWFNDGNMDHKAEYMTQFIFESGSWGTHEHSALAQGVKTKQEEGTTKSLNKFNMTKSILFPKFEIMAGKYEILNSAPILLPVMWVWRWIEVLIFRRENIKLNHRHIIEVSAISDDSISEYEEQLRYLGLNFTFEEVKNDSEM